MKARGRRRAPWAVAPWLAVLAVGCRPPHAGPAGAAPAPPVEAVRASLGRLPVPAGVEASGVLRARLSGRALPALDLRARATPDSGGATLRPGMLPPTVTLWSAGREWQVGLPRQKAVVRSPEPDAAPPGAAARLLWYLLVPRALAADLARPVLIESRGEWVLRGELSSVGEWARAAEVALDPATGGVRRWSLWLPSGASTLRVGYSRPVTDLADGVTASFFVPALGAEGDLALNQVRSRAAQGLPRQAIPSGWEILAAESLPEVLAGVSESEP